MCGEISNRGSYILNQELVEILLCKSIKGMLTVTSQMEKIE